MPRPTARLLGTAAVLFLALAPIPAQMGVQNPANGHTYLLSSPGLDYLMARAQAAAQGGYLCAINDAAEAAFIAQNFPMTRLWIGLTDEVTEGTFVWDSGEPLNYTNWAPGEPNNFGGNEDYVEWDGTLGNQWNDQALNGNGLVSAGLIEVPGGPPLWQTNQAGAGLDIDGILATGPFGNPAITTKCLNDPAVVTLASNRVGNPWDLVISVDPVVPVGMGGIGTPGAQAINVDAVTPTLPLTWLNGGALPNLATTAFPVPTIPIPINAPSIPVSVSIQLIVVDPTNAFDGVALSQAVQFDTVNPQPAFPLAGPTTNDGSVAIPSCVSFYGTTYTQLFVNDNGRITFGSASADNTASIGEALFNQPFIGYWTDFDVSAGGPITISSPSAGVLVVSYSNVAYQGELGTTSSFTITHDGNNGTWTLDGLQGIAANPLTTFGSNDATFLGLSRGGSVATQPPMITPFAIGGTGTPAVPTDMIYQYISAGAPFAIGQGVNRIDFTPAPGPTYSWLGS